MLDRSPCGSGTAAIVASNWSKGLFTIGREKQVIHFLLCEIYRIELKLCIYSYTYLFTWMILGDTFKNKSIVGSEFVATVKELGPTIGTYDTGNLNADWMFIT